MNETRNEQWINRRILALSSSTGVDGDKRLDTLWNEHLREQEVARQLGRLNALSANGELAQNELQRTYANAKYGNHLHTETLTVHNSLIATSEAGVYPGVLNITYTIFPELLEIGKVHYVNIKPRKGNLTQMTNGVSLWVTAHPIGTELQLVIALANTTEMITTSKDVTFDAKTRYEKTLRVGFDDIVRIDYIFENVITEVINTETGEVNDVLDITEKETIIHASCEECIQINHIKPNITSKYVKPVIITHELLHIQQYASELTAANELMYDVEDPAIDVGITANFIDVIYAYGNVSQSFTLLLERLWYRDLQFGLALQTNLYKLSWSDERVVTNLESEVEQLMGLAIDTSAKLADLSSQVVRYTPREFTFKSEPSMSLIPMVPFIPLRHVREFWYDQSGANTNAPWDKNVITFTDKTSSHNFNYHMTENVLVNAGPSNVTKVVKILETDNAYGFIIVNFARRELAGELQSYDKIRRQRVLQSSWYQLGTWAQELSRYSSTIQVKPGIIALEGREAEVTCTVRRLVISPKNISGIPGHKSQNLTWYAWFADVNYSGRCGGGSPDQIEYEGNLYYGIGYDVGMNATSTARLTTAHLKLDVQTEVLRTEMNMGDTTTTFSESLGQAGINFNWQVSESYSPTIKFNFDLTSDNIYTYWETLDEKASLQSFNAKDVVTLLGLENTGVNRKVAEMLGFGFMVIGDVSIDVPEPPVYLGVLGYASSYIFSIDAVIQDMMNDINTNREMIHENRAYIEWLDRQLQLLIESLESSWWDSLFGMFMDIASGFVIGAAAGLVFDGLTRLSKRAAGSSWRHSNIAISQMSQRGAFTKSHIKDLPTEGINEAINMQMIVAKSRNKKMTDILDGERPVYLTDPSKSAKRQDFDTVDKMDIVTAIRTGGKYADGTFPTNVKVANSMSNFAGEGAIPTMSIMYRPLGVGPPGLAKMLHEKVTMRSGISDQLRLNAKTASTHQPSHSFAVFEDTRRTTTGYRHSKMLVGIGELNKNGTATGDFGAQLGGVQITWDSICKTPNGRMIWKKNSYTESGYNDDDVKNLFTTLFVDDRKNLANVMTTEEMWDVISSEVSKKVNNSNLVHHAYVPDTSKLAAIRALIDKPNKTNYSLLYQNCQHFTRDMAMYVRNGNLPPQWTATDKTALLTGRIKYLDDFLLESEAFIRDFTSERTVSRPIVRLLR